MANFVQGYLNLAYHKMSELKQEAGKISNIDLQRLVIRVFYYLCVVTLQVNVDISGIFFVFERR